MKITTPIKINVTELKHDLTVSVDKVIVPELVSAGAVVSGKKDENGNKIMIINGDIDLETIEEVFDQYNVEIDDYIVDDMSMIPDYDDVQVFDSKKANVNGEKLNEKKADKCCPPKKKSTISVYEALNLGKSESLKVADLDTVIDSIAGKHLSESVKNVAITKAKNEFLKSALGTQKYNAVLESAQVGNQSMHADTKINGKRIAEYTTDELKSLLEKVNGQIADLKVKVSNGLNENADEKKIKDAIALKEKVQAILDDEISFRDAMEYVKEDEESTPSFEFKNLNPNASDDEEKKEEKTDAKNESDEAETSEENAEETEEKTDDNEEQNPDEDEVVELGSVVITLASEDAANDLKNDCVEAGIPEDAIEIEPVEDETEEDEDSESDEENTDAETSEENTEDAATEEETPSESVKTSGNAVNEDEEENTDEPNIELSADEEETEGGEENADAETSEESGEDKAFKFILTDTDYVDKLATVLEDIWGMEKSEFEDLIGGEIVSSEDEETDSEEDGENEEKSDDADNSEVSTEDDFDDFNPDDIFKDL